MKNEILIVDECAFDEEAIALMKSVTSVQQGTCHNEEELIALLQENINKDSIRVIITDTVPISAKIMDLIPNLRGILVHGVGYNHIDVASSNERKIFVVNQPGANSQSVAELTITLLLCCAKHLIQADLDTKKGNWRPQEFIGLELHEKTLGIIGLGSIGKIVATIAKGFGMNVLYTSRNRKIAIEKDYNFYANHQTLGDISKVLQKYEEAILAFTNAINLIEKNFSDLTDFFHRFFPN